jgi:hypothetical protein
LIIPCILLIYLRRSLILIIFFKEVCVLRSFLVLLRCAWWHLLIKKICWFCILLLLIMRVRFGITVPYLLSWYLVIKNAVYITKQISFRLSVLLFIIIRWRRHLLLQILMLTLFNLFKLLGLLRNISFWSCLFSRLLLYWAWLVMLLSYIDRTSLLNHFFLFIWRWSLLLNSLL